MNTPDGPIKVEKVDCEKDLGVIFDSNMKFGEHISSKVTKANQILELIFRTFTLVDHTSVYEKDIIQIENIQRRAPRLVSDLKHLSYPERLKTLGPPTLE